MFYYSETKYLYEAKERQLQPGMKGFVKITFRGQKGTVQLHLGDRSQNGREEAKITLYLSSKKRPLREILLKDFILENGKLQFHCALEENCSGEEEIWFGCLVRAQNKQYTEDGIYTDDLLTYGEKTQDNLIHVDFSSAKKREKAGFAIAEYAQEYYVEMPSKDRVDDDPYAGEPEQESAENGYFEQDMEETDTIKPEKEEMTDGKTGMEQAGEGIEETEAEQIQRPEWIPDEICITDLRELERIHERWTSFLQNSFLLHGFYNYKHVVATATLLGVPGNYYEREKKVAGMFGFNSFLSPNELKDYLTGAADFLEEKIEAGAFGYYLCRIPAR